MARELIRLDDIHKAFGAVAVLDGIDLRIEDGERIGVVGYNGSGKTTLLNIISKRNQDIGKITYAPALRIAFLTQVRDIEEDATLQEELNRRGRQFLEIEEEITAIEAQMAEPSFYDGEWQASMDRYQELQSVMARSGGGDAAGHAQEILKALELAHHPLDMPVSKLSGGERAKVALARQLVGLGEIDVFLLDEPTNHLDVDAKEALEEALEDYTGSIIAVSHDRWFLERICNAIWHLPSNGEIRVYPGGYSDFLRHTAI